MTELHDWQEHVYHMSKHDDFFESDEWFILRLQVFKRDKYICLRCDKKFPSEKLNAHHLIPREEGGGDSLSNLVTLCQSCHDVVEIGGFTNTAQIIGSYESPQPKEEPKKYEKPMKETFERPEWHKYVYGGKKRPR